MSRAASIRLAGSFRTEMWRYKAVIRTHAEHHPGEVLVIDCCKLDASIQTALGLLALAVYAETNFNLQSRIANVSQALRHTLAQCGELSSDNSPGYTIIHENDTGVADIRLSDSRKIDALRLYEIRRDGRQIHAMARTAIDAVELLAHWLEDFGEFGDLNDPSNDLSVAEILEIERCQMTTLLQERLAVRHSPSGAQSRDKGEAVDSEWGRRTGQSVDSEDDASESAPAQFTVVDHHDALPPDCRIIGTLPSHSADTPWTVVEAPASVWAQFFGGEPRVYIRHLPNAREHGHDLRAKPE